MDNRVIYLRGTSSSFTVQLPAYAQVKGPFTLKCVGAVLTSSGATPACSIHCSYGSGANVYDTAGWGNTVALLTSDWTSAPQSPTIVCPGLGEASTVTVQIRQLSNDTAISAVNLAVIALEIHPTAV